MARKSFNEVKDGGANLLGKGKYEVEITAVEMGTTKANSYPKAMVTYEHKDDDGNVKLAFQHLTLTEKALGFTKSLLSACGYDIDELEYEVVEKGKKEGHVTAFYFEGEQYDLDQLLLEEKVMITIEEDNSPYKDPVTGDTVPRDKPQINVTRTEAL